MNEHAKIAVVHVPAGYATAVEFAKDCGFELVESPEDMCVMLSEENDQLIERNAALRAINDRMRRALDFIAAMHGKTLIAPSMGFDYDSGHQMGALAAFNQCAEAAQNAIVTSLPLQDGETTTGFAVTDPHGRILVRTISDTRRAAIVNWLCTEAGLLATHFARDEQIEQAWQDKHGLSELVQVSIGVTQYIADERGEKP